MSKNSKKRRTGAVVGMVIAIIVLLGIAAFLYIQGKMSQVNRETLVSNVVPREQQTFEVDENAEPDTIKPDEVEWQKVETPEPEKVEGVKNLLLIGQDARVGQQR